MIRSYESPNPDPERHTFRDLIQGREEEFPVLARAAANTVPATNVEIEWITAQTESSIWTRKNQCQIIRFPYETRGVVEGSPADPQIGDEPKEAALTKFLEAVEQTLVYGKPSLTQHGHLWRRTCGGVRFYLGRDLEAKDSISLRPLREPVFRRFTHHYNEALDSFELSDSPISEWLAEFSLQVQSG